MSWLFKHKALQAYRLKTYQKSSKKAFSATERVNCKNMKEVELNFFALFLIVGVKINTNLPKIKKKNFCINPFSHLDAFMSDFDLLSFFSNLTHF